ncbi:hypothetical protein V1477_017361 [Vespula maculifrons]|uniref:Uncharacterized protein n=1 Tax=Vespula maculifrons TaxID=7453 RepID=A0ABD2B5U1_VESMC
MKKKKRGNNQHQPFSSDLLHSPHPFENSSNLETTEGFRNTCYLVSKMLTKNHERLLESTA